MIGPEYTGLAEGHGDALVYIPSQRTHRGACEVTLELRNLTDGRLAVLAFSSLKLLVEGCGPHQPWIAVPALQIDELRHGSGADTVLWDAALPQEERYASREES